jgi:hypothetical protein
MLLKYFVSHNFKMVLVKKGLLKRNDLSNSLYSYAFMYDLRSIEGGVFDSIEQSLNTLTERRFKKL